MTILNFTTRLMDRNSRLWLLLVLINILIISSASYGEVVTDTKIDSLREALNNKTGKDKISS